MRLQHMYRELIDDVAAFMRTLSLPIWHGMRRDQVARVTEACLHIARKYA